MSRRCIVRIVDRKTFMGLPSGTVFWSLALHPEPGLGGRKHYDRDCGIRIKGETEVVQLLIAKKGVR